ncbi:chemotaxis protein CheW [Sphingomonas sp. AP4-R1]|uniref:chemotaxis protein CheW n=1 Tax=Sphingomonas sp. AP4-R1 TaxID=2735134 RepID=UPI001493AC0D|nr:chemotaxis protein CheW [Sphingomonas sp. AP4-R1]QJU56941.1 chemotaxis protein CheW [Sphingomonas sp. AP4-R1]
MSGIVTAADIVLDTDGLDPTRAARLLARRAAQLRADRAPVESGLAVMVWMVGPERFALPLLDIASVMAAGRTTPVPGAPETLIGLASRRGRLINVVDPAAALGLARPRRDGEGHLLLLRGTSPKLALRVDRAEGVMMLAQDESEPGEDLTRQAMLADGERLLLVNRRLLVEALGLAGQQRGF